MILSNLVYYSLVLKFGKHVLNLNFPDKQCKMVCQKKITENFHQDIIIPNVKYVILANGIILRPPYQYAFFHSYPILVEIILELKINNIDFKK